MSANAWKARKTGGLVQSKQRGAVARPQPPMQDRRTKRSRDRGAVKRRAIEEGR